jgi:hypothetical protein
MIAGIGRPYPHAACGGKTQRGDTACVYSTKVRITVRAGDAIIVREGIGTGVGKSASTETADEIALKAAPDPEREAHP